MKYFLQLFFPRFINIQSFVLCERRLCFGNWSCHHPFAIPWSHSWCWFGCWNLVRNNGPKRWSWNER
eukprot:UN27046